MHNRRIALVEDSPAAAESLRRYLDRYAQEHGISFDCSHFAEADSFLQCQRAFDAILLDIDLPGIDGLACAKEIRARGDETPLVFVTNLSQMAVQGYTVDAVGFLVKPVVYTDFADRMSRVIRLLERAEQRYLSVATRSGAWRLAVVDINYIEVRGHYVIYHADGLTEPLRVRGNLANVERQLAGSSFVRLSSGYLANMDKIISFQGQDVQLSCGTTLRMSRGKKQEATRCIVSYLAGGLIMPRSI